MSYDLVPRNKEVGTFSFGIFSWSWMMLSGVGLVIGCGQAMKPLTEIHRGRDGEGTPFSNDGYRVTALEAKMMAAAARGLVGIQRCINKEWESLTGEQRENAKRLAEDKIYKPSVRDDFIEKAEKFADWAEKSGGFRIV